MGARLMQGLMVLAASTIGGLLGYGTYGYLKDKKKMSSWGAGAATGAITGVLAMGLTMVMPGQTAGLKGTMGQLSAGRRQIASSRNRLAAGRRFPVLQNMGALVVEQLRGGCASCG